MKDIYRDFARKYLHVVDSISRIRTIRVKSKSKRWFDIDALNTIQDLDKQYKQLKLSSKEIEKLTENKKNTKEL